MSVTIDKFEYATDLAAHAAWLSPEAQTLSYTLTNDSGNTAGANDRMIVPASAITTSGGSISVTLEGVSSGTSVTIGGCSIGERSGTSGNFASAPTRITFGGSNTGTLPGFNGTLTSDRIDFAVDESKSYLIHIYYSGNNVRRFAIGLLGRYYRQNYGTDDTLTQDISALAYTNDTYMIGLKKFKIFDISLPNSESIIKKEGSYSMKIVAPITTSLNKTLTRTVSPTINLTDQTSIKFWVRASRTGTNFKLGFHDSGGTTTESNVAISSADTWEEKTIDISAVANANKDGIDSVVLTITNADAENTIYLDYMMALSLDEGVGGGGGILVGSSVLIS